MKSLGTIDAVTPEILGKPGIYQFSCLHKADYRSPPRAIPLHLLVLHDAGEIYTLISTSEFGDASKVTNLAGLTDMAKTAHCEPVCLTRPLRLETVTIPKPWGQEIWYSGIEQRGVSTVNGIPLPWLLDVFGDHLGCHQAPVLLKILAPFPEPDLGDLYFEMHRQKIEVYVVTHVDPDAWPSGAGKIRYGFNQALIASFESPEKFLNSYRRAVNDYRLIRNKIDAGLRELKVQQGLSLSEPLSPGEYQNLINQIDRALIDDEERLRQSMYRYTSTQDLQVGDVVTVAPMVPHSLQHGVRVIEFQTPHYERYILSFGQEVLTQDHWDTDTALYDAKTDIDNFEKPEQLAPGQDLVADFEAFRVIRIKLMPGESAQTSHKNYVMMIGVAGEMTVDEDTHIGPEEAWYFSPKAVLEFSNTGSSPATILVAEECVGND